MGLNGGSLRAKRVCRGIRRFWSLVFFAKPGAQARWKTKVLPGPLLWSHWFNYCSFGFSFYCSASPYRLTLVIEARLNFPHASCSTWSGTHPHRETSAQIANSNQSVWVHITRWKKQTTASEAAAAFHAFFRRDLLSVVASWRFHNMATPPFRRSGFVMTNRHGNNQLVTVVLDYIVI